MAVTPDHPDAPNARENAQEAVQIALCDFVGDLLDAWGDHAAAAQWRSGTEECSPAKAATVLAETVSHPPIMLDPARLHRIEGMMRRLLFYLAWRRMSDRLDDEELKLWMRVLEPWHARAWSTQGRISA